MATNWKLAYQTAAALLVDNEERLARYESENPHDMEWYLRWCAALLRQDDKGELADRLDAIADELEANDGT